MEIVLNNDEYVYYKYINTLIYVKNYEEFFNEFVSRFGKPGLHTLVMLNAIVLDLKNIIDSDMERNILNFTNYLKEASKNEEFYSMYKDISIDFCFYICNEIISHVNKNKIKKDSATTYCINQLALRGFGFIDRIILTDNNHLASTFKTLKTWNVEDFEVLLSLYSDKKGVIFEHVKDEYSNPNNLHITCIKILVQENPDLFKDIRFLVRVKYILDHYNENIKNGNYCKNAKRKMLVRNHRALEKELIKSTVK